MHPMGRDGAGGFGVSVFHIVELTPYGRQESWENSPEGWPQVPTYTRGGLHVELSAEELSGATAPSRAGN